MTVQGRPVRERSGGGYDGRGAARRASRGRAQVCTQSGAPAVTTLIENEMRLKPPETIHD
ncbi:hypothetical protein E2C01_059802 [Portunus trituberculatus]|uniref:Uncharacterized protein n=1 Tax=Portunus trituberculatus TaxID=210409 RepID=A0A5B7HAA4_PORTR|nr:hypothetical protein [Portunus trituberculatus]